MKKSTLFFFILCCNQLIFAQNWSPANLSDKYNFQNDTADFITNTIWVDSVKIENGDSIFYLNKIVKPCDTCQFTSSILINQNQFLQQQISKNEDEKYLFEGEKELVIFPFSNLNEAWLFDTLNNIEATVSNIQEDFVFGTLDSIKTIALSNNDSILLSKNHGILFFPKLYGEDNFNLVGIEGRNLGELVPNFWEFFDFEIGDIFQIEETNFYFPATETIKRKVEILDKTIIGDSLIYEISFIQETTIETQALPTIVSAIGPIVDNWVFVYDSTDFYAKYPHQFVLGQNGGNCDSLYNNSYSYHFIDENGFFTKQSSPQNIDELFVHPYSNFNQLDPDVYSLETCCRYAWQYKEGLGLTFYQDAFFENGETYKLIGFTNGIDTIGTILPDEDILSKTGENNFEETEISLFPNPSNGQFFINLKNPLKEHSNLEIYNNKSQIVYKQQFMKGEQFLELNLNELGNGLYIIKISGQQTNYSTKITILK